MESCLRSPVLPQLTIVVSTISLMIIFGSASMNVDLWFSTLNAHYNHGGALKNSNFPETTHRDPDLTGLDETWASIFFESPSDYVQPVLNTVNR